MLGPPIIFMKLPYWTKSAGTGGKIKTPEDFIVREILHRKYFARYKTAGRVEKREGKYNIFLLRKKGVTTHRALRIVSQKFGAEKIGFAGLKDKYAVTEQYITIKGGQNFSDAGIEL